MQIEYYSNKQDLSMSRKESTFARKLATAGTDTFRDITESPSLIISWIACLSMKAASAVRFCGDMTMCQSGRRTRYNTIVDGQSKKTRPGNDKRTMTSTIAFLDVLLVNGHRPRPHNPRLIGIVFGIGLRQ
jgi:hypothetical protein